MSKYISTKKRGRKKYSFLFGKLVLIVFLGVISCFSIILLFQQSQKTERLRVDLKLKTIVGSLIQEQQDLLEITHDYLRTLSFVPDIISGNDPVCYDILSEILRGQSFFINFGVADEHGNIVCSGFPIEEIVSASDQEWFQVTKENGRFSVGEYQLGRITGKPSINFGFPIIEDGQIVRVLFATVGLEVVNKLLYNPNLVEGSSLLFLDKQGKILSRFPYPEVYVGMDILGTALDDPFEQRFSGLREMEDIDGEWHVLSFSPIYYDQKNHIGTIVYGILKDHSPVSKATIGLVGAVLSLFVLLFFAIPRRFQILPTNKKNDE